MKKISQIQLFFSLGIIFIYSVFFAFATPAQAGGGSIQLVNFSDSQQIGGKSFSPIVAIKDPSTNYSSYLVGEKFSMRAHSDLSGASCTTTQSVTDSQGRIKADCKADIYGNFIFDLVDAEGRIQMTTNVFFVDPKNLSGSGFNEETPAGLYTVKISSGNQTVKPNQIFSPSVELRKNGQVVSNYDEVDYFNWEVLQGSFVYALNANTERLMKSPKIFIPYLGKTVLRVTAVMKNGDTYQSGVVTIISSNSNGYNNNFNNGYNNNYNNGYNNHYNNGYNNHYNNGFNNHYNNGYNNHYNNGYRP